MDRDLASGGVPARQRLTLAFGIAYETAVLAGSTSYPARYQNRARGRAGGRYCRCRVAASEQVA